MNGIGTDPRRWAAPFFTIWIGQMFSLVGSALGQFALVWWLTASTGSAAVLATASAAALLPTVLLGPLAGALVDRWDRRRTMIVADGAVALASAALAWLFWRGELQTWQVYAIVLVRAAGNLFHWPAMQASTALMVPERHLARVAGANQAARGAADIAAPPLGALLLALMPIYGVMLLDVATALMAIMPLCFVAVPRPERAAGALPSLRRDLRQGLAYVWRRVALRRVCGLTMMLHFFIVPPLVCCRCSSPSALAAALPRWPGAVRPGARAWWPAAWRWAPGAVFAAAP
jgi:DHA3 family macrolide efflux protein-like MFS transporter